MTTPHPATIASFRARYIDAAHSAPTTAALLSTVAALREEAASLGAAEWTAFCDGTLAMLHRNPATANDQFDLSIALAPSFALPWHGKGNALTAQGRHDDALAAYDHALALDPSLPLPWLGKARVYVSLRRFAEALAALDTALALDPRHPGAWNAKGIVLGMLDRHEEALEAYRSSLALQPDFGGAYYNIGLLHWLQQRPRDAEAAFRSALGAQLDADARAAATLWLSRAARATRMAGDGKWPTRLEEADRKAIDSLGSDLYEALKSDLDGIRQKKLQFKTAMSDAVSRPRVIGTVGADDMLLVLRDWNSFSPILPRALRGRDDPGPDDRRGGGYFLAWKGHGIVIDPGMDFVPQLYRKGLSIADIDTVIITHCHLDHTRDTEALVDLNYRHNRARGRRPHRIEADFRQLQFCLCDSALTKYSDYLKDSGCCNTPLQLTHKSRGIPLTPSIDVRAVAAHHHDINGREYEAIGLVFELKDGGVPVVRLGITSDTKWMASLAHDYAGCHVLVAHLGTIEVGEGDPTTTTRKTDDPAPCGDSDKTGFLETDLPDHLGAKGCFRLLHQVRPQVLVISEFGEELVETRFKLLQVLKGLKPPETQLVLGGDSNLTLGLGKALSVCCSHPECAQAWTRIALNDVRPVLGGDYLFQYTCPRHELV